MADTADPHIRRALRAARIPRLLLAGHLHALGFYGGFGLNDNSIERFADTGGRISTDEALHDRRRAQMHPRGETGINQFEGRLGAHDPTAEIGQDENTFAIIGPFNGGSHLGGVGAQSAPG